MLRNKQTHQKKILWNALKENQLLGLRFKRQHPIDLFVVDLYCHKCKFVIDIDGHLHFRKDQISIDHIKTESLGNFGLRIFRISNEEIETEIDLVSERIRDIIKSISSADSVDTK